ncbi:MAG: JAB domain-containing protein [Candidatus Rokuibacteriota bacterium]
MVREAPAARARVWNSAAVAAFVRPLIPDDAREHFGVLLLDSRNGLVGWHEVSTGTLSSSLVHPRDVFGPALRVMGVAALVLVHNHPSGDPTPSLQDLRLTRQLVKIARLLDVPVHDHVILGDGTGEHASLTNQGEMSRGRA